VIAKILTGGGGRGRARARAVGKLG